MIKVKVRNIGADTFTGSPILLLENVEDENQIFPIWIGLPEAEGIIMYKAGIKTPRPMTYDLIKSIIMALNATVDHVAVIDKQNNIYIAEIVLKNKDGEEIKVDARPSDAINIALRFNVPIYIDENVVQSVNLKDIKKIDSSAEDKVSDFTNERDEEIKDVKDLEKSVNELENSVKNVKDYSEDIDKELEEFRKFLDTVKPEDFDISKNKN
ncbi:MAG: bifunctional nuclease family protein [Persephonella sp.]|nr:MAG: bifunctional nuclease family protein [Persephonella sp.]RUM61116.1 MAG: bifunctional nuclease family protein [Persephonella sp.]